MKNAEQVQAILSDCQARGLSRADTIQLLAAGCLGWPYVYGAAGEMCTPETRRKYAGYNQQYAEDIRRPCPVLSGKQTTCDGCQWIGCRCFDCRGFTRWLLESVGLSLTGGGATSQWETASNWAAKGEIASIPAGLVCCVFKRRDGKMSHTGMRLEDGSIIHCATTVKTDALPGRPAWTHWGVPAGLYTTEKLRKAGIDVDEAKNTPTIRRGAEGELVKTLQARLNDLTGAGLTVDGKFGAKTEAAVIHFQGLHDLTEDGIVGPKTWAALGILPDADPEDDGYREPVDGVITPTDSVILSKADFAALKEAYAAMGAVIKKYEGE